jgi:cation-transporting ATPase I
VVIDASALTTGRMSVTDIVTAAQGAVAERARQRVLRMFDPQRPTAVVRDGHWRLGPLAELDVAVPDGLSAAPRTARTRHDATLGLLRDRQVVAVAGLTADRDPMVEVVVAAAHQLGRVVVAPARRYLVEESGVDGAVPGGSRLAASVRALQREGHVVIVIAGCNESALTAADCGIGVIAAGSPPPWAAHLLCGPGLTDAWLILQAARAARTTADRSAHLALLGTVTGALIAGARNVPLAAGAPCRSTSPHWRASSPAYGR